jgi:hypothetical protein
VFVGAIQAFVFDMLTMVFMAQATLGMVMSTERKPTKNLPKDIVFS